MVPTVDSSIMKVRKGHCFTIVVLPIGGREKQGMKNHHVNVTRFFFMKKCEFEICWTF